MKVPRSIELLPWSAGTEFNFEEFEQIVPKLEQEERFPSLHSSDMFAAPPSLLVSPGGTADLLPRDTA